MTSADARIRDAVEADAPALTELIREAKASWGYPEAWLREWEDSLRITPEEIRAHDVLVAEDGGALVGVVAVVGDPEPEITHLWIRSDRQGRGIGRELLERAMRIARGRGWQSLRIESDPHARPFYERMGATYVGEVPAPVAGTDRTLPRLELPLASPSGNEVR